MSGRTARDGRDGRDGRGEPRERAPRAAACAVVLAGGDPVDPRLLGPLPDAAVVIAADSGLHLAEPLGLRVHTVVGDCDSVDPAALEQAVAAGARLERHPVAKDETDLELALRAAVAAGAARIVVVGGGGGRLDHLLANLLLLASPAFAGVEVEGLLGGGTRVRAIHDRADLQGEPGDLLTLLALGGPARGVRTSGLRYPLHGEDLHPGSTRGVSNEFAEPVATVTVGSGVLLAVQPGVRPGRQ